MNWQLSVKSYKTLSVITKNFNIFKMKIELFYEKVVLCVLVENLVLQKFCNLTIFTEILNSSIRAVYF